MLEKEGFERGLPVQAEIPICSEMKMANSFTEIQCITASTLKFINNARSQTKRNAIFKSKKDNLCTGRKIHRS